MTAEEFWDHVKVVHATYGGQLRLGQCWFNELYVIRQDLADQVRSSGIDPYYVDSRLPKANDFIRINWPFKQETLL